MAVMFTFILVRKYLITQFNTKTRLSTTSQALKTIHDLARLQRHQYITWEYNVDYVTYAY